MLLGSNANRAADCREHPARKSGKPVRKKPICPGRAGFTLIELLVVMTVGAALMVAAIRVFVPLMHVHARYVAEVARQTQTWEIATLWRRDAGAARGVTYHGTGSSRNALSAAGQTEPPRTEAADAAARAARQEAGGEPNAGASAEQPAWSVEFAMSNGARTVWYRFYPRTQMLRRYERVSDAAGGPGTLLVRQWRIDGQAVARVRPLAAESGDAEAETAVELRLRYRLLIPVSGRSLEGRFREYSIVGLVR